VPGVLSGLVFLAFVPEKNRQLCQAHSLKFGLKQMPPRFRRYLLGVGLFGAGDFAHTMLILAATQLLTPSWGPLTCENAASS